MLSDEVYIASAIVSASFEGLPCEIYLGLTQNWNTFILSSSGSEAVC